MGAAHMSSDVPSDRSLESFGFKISASRGIDRDVRDGIRPSGSWLARLPKGSELSRAVFDVWTRGSILHLWTVPKWATTLLQGGVEDRRHLGGRMAQARRF